jgi:hypothetical protein
MAFSSELFEANSVIEAPGAHLIKPDSAWLVKDIFFRRRLRHLSVFSVPRWFAFY